MCCALPPTHTENNNYIFVYLHTCIPVYLYTCIPCVPLYLHTCIPCDHHTTAEMVGRYTFCTFSGSSSGRLSFLRKYAANERIRNIDLSKSMDQKQ